jgi:CRAL/TRIO domain
MTSLIHNTLNSDVQILKILQDHYPERLGLALILNVPLLIRTFYKIITPFIDPVTRFKMRFNPSVITEEIFAPEMVMKEWWGGDRDFVYEHDKFWPALVNMCENRRKEWFDAWKKLGGTVGLKEWDYKMATVSGGASEKVEDPVEKQEEPASATLDGSV